MYCRFGKRCFFIHDERTVEDVQKDSYYQRKLGFGTITADFSKDNNKPKRLNFFREITQ
jgi:hypothetical protein